MYVIRISNPRRASVDYAGARGFVSDAAHASGFRDLYRAYDARDCLRLFLALDDTVDVLEL